jgi:hypothetical protein
MQEARRLRSATVLRLLESALAWLVDALRTRTPKRRRIIVGNAACT